MSQSGRIDAFETDVAVLIAIFFLQWMGKPTSVNSICSYFQGELLKPDAVKDALARLQSARALIIVKSGRGIPPIFKIEFSELNAYFSSAVASASTQYRSFQVLESMGLVSYDNGKYLFNADGFLKFLDKNGLDISQSLKLLTDIFEQVLQSPIPLISEQKFVELLNGKELPLDGNLISFSDEFLEICQKALSLNAT